MSRSRAGGARRRESQRSLALGALALVACCYILSSAFVGPTLRAAPARAHSSVALQSTGEYTGFVPDMQRRMLMNLVAVAATAVPVAVLLGGYIWYFIPQTGGGGGGGTLCGDENGNPIVLADWVKNHKPNDRELVQGIRGDPTYLISTEDGIKDFAINAVCTHLGCVVPWVRASNRFICPCHGSQYDENGKVVRGPAPLSLAITHASVGEGKVSVSPWTETDFRTGIAPWWNK
mmetsp:Transcript_12861/g.26060  ORF Transcript_12861/g.26060 Transcript_12861/m.26060 type:complete len:234 (-) Transcript_12861:129-830(-)|eukprot:CAMPEP_0113819080 /NCGR_PEP_ID=MMETSP0328-20130328/561_1 /TAXON_ID=39455 /ORGANISM="Alexandrium minutum" /LENGTH=233 /DNA_ID=CAMNT_0000787015 /DNA_START=72 /DNA_END=773 /DNA_ORIENTATION=+ /assembly_acc=CAM_ASM_000350